MTSQNSRADASQDASFKEQLDQAATEARTDNQQKQRNPVAETIAEYVPGAAKALGSGSHPDEPNKAEIPGPPERPAHDDKIEEFVREQHGSKGAGGALSTQE